MDRFFKYLKVSIFKQMDIPWRSFSLQVIRINIHCFSLILRWDTFGTQSFFILPSCGTLEQTHSYAPSSLPNVYFLLLTLNMIVVSSMYIISYLFCPCHLELTGQSLLRDEQCCSPSACKCSPPSGPAWSRSWNAWLTMSWSIVLYTLGSHKPPTLQYNTSAHSVHRGNSKPAPGPDIKLS